VLLVKEETVLQDITIRLTEIGTCYGIEMKVEKPKVMRISMEPSPVGIIINLGQMENMEYLNYLDSMMTK
jgi:hypothetical protein